MITYYRWHVLGASGKFITPPEYTDEWGDLISLLDYYETEYAAIKGLEDYLTWECPVFEEEFVLHKLYRK